MLIYHLKGMFIFPTNISLVKYFLKFPFIPILVKQNPGTDVILVTYTLIPEMTLPFICLLGGVCTCTCQAESNLSAFVLSFTTEISWDPTQVTRCGHRNLYTMSHFPSPDMTKCLWLLIAMNMCGILLGKRYFKFFSCLAVWFLSGSKGWQGFTRHGCLLNFNS